MRFEIKWMTVFVLLGLFVVFAGRLFADDRDAIEVAKAKAKAILALKSPAVMTSIAAATAKAKSAAKPLYIWVKIFRKEIAEKLPDGVHVKVDEYHGTSEPHLVIKIEEGGYQLEQSKLDQSRIDAIRQIVSPERKSKRPPMIDVSRESEEPPLLETTTKQPLTVGKSCLCSSACVCGCQAGQPCQCKTTYPGIPDSSIQAGSGEPYRGVAAAAWPAPAGQITGPVSFGERMGPAPVTSFFQ